MICILLLPLEVFAFRKIQLPSISPLGLYASPGEDLVVFGDRFPRTNLKSYRVYLLNQSQRIRLQILALSSNFIKLKIPRSLSYGTYDLSLKIESRYFRSKRLVLKDFLKVAPEAPPKPVLLFDIINDLSQLDSILKDNMFHGHILSFNREIKPGLNQLQVFYEDELVGSLLSEPVPLYYAPRDVSSLEIRSGRAILKIAQEEITVDSIVRFQQIGLQQFYYLISPDDERYLLKSVELSPVFFSNVVISGEESVTITNRSSRNFSLANCILKDDLKVRHSFLSSDLIEIAGSITITKSLGLNDIGPDSISLICSDVLIDKYSY